MPKAQLRSAVRDLKFTFAATDDALLTPFTSAPFPSFPFSYIQLFFFRPPLFNYVRTENRNKMIQFSEFEHLFSTVQSVPPSETNILPTIAICTSRYDSGQFSQSLLQCHKCVTIACFGPPFALCVFRHFSATTH